MNNLRAMIQDELKQALVGLIPLPTIEMTPVTNIFQPARTILPVVISPIIAPIPAAVASPTALIIVGDPLPNNDNVGRQPMNAAMNASNVEVNLEDVENHMIEKVNREWLEQVQKQESKQMQALNQKMTKMEELMRGQSMGYSFDIGDILCTEENKLLDNFEMPQL